MSLELVRPGDEALAKRTQWLVPALFSWLADERVRETAIRERCATAHGVKLLGGILHMSLMTGKPVDPRMLKQSALDLLGNRKVRRLVARLVLERQAQLREENPLEAPPRRKPKDVLAELQDLRTELETESETGIIRPW